MASVLFSKQILWVWEEKAEGPSAQAHHLLYPFKSYQGSVYRAEKIGYDKAALLGAFINQCWPVGLSVMVKMPASGLHTVIQQ